jgi:hypothetical protein
VAHNGSLVPVPGRDIKVQAWYQGGISVFDFTDRTNPFEIATSTGAPQRDRLATGGQWSSYWYNGLIIGSEIARGLDVLRLTPSEHLTQNELDAANLISFDEFNPQHQPRSSGRRTPPWPGPTRTSWSGAAPCPMTSGRCSSRCSTATRPVAPTGPPPWRPSARRPTCCSGTHERRRNNGDAIFPAVGVRTGRDYRGIQQVIADLATQPVKCFTSSSLMRSGELHLEGDHPLIWTHDNQIDLVTPVLRPQVTNLRLLRLRIDPDALRDQRLEEVAEQGAVSGDLHAGIITFEECLRRDAEQRCGQGWIGELVLVGARETRDLVA